MLAKLEVKTDNNLRAIRIAEGIKLTELAIAADVSTRTVERAEQGNASVSAVSKARIVKGLNQLAGKEEKYSLSEVFLAPALASRSRKQ